ARLIYFTNVGTIPEESTWRVFSEKGVPLGNLSERFIERVRPKEVFVLGGKTYEFIQTKGTKVFVRDAHGRKPTIPSWAGEAMSRSRELALAMTRLRDEMSRRMAEDTQSEVVDWLEMEYGLDRELALNLIRQYRSQITVAGHVPSSNKLLVEGYTDVRGDPNIIVHTSLGRAVNEVLARVVAVRVARKHRSLRVRTVLDDDAFALLLDEEVDLEEVVDALRVVPLEEDLREVLPGSELFHQRFRHCSTRAFLILRNYRGREVPITRQHQQAARLYDDLVDDEEFPVTKETYEESLHQAMDLETAEAIATDLASGDRVIEKRAYSDSPSPFAFKLLLMGMSDLLLIEDRSVLLRELHADVLAKVMPKADITKPRYELEEVVDFYTGKRGMVDFNTKGGMLELLERMGPLPLTADGDRSIQGFSRVTPATAECWLRELVDENKVVSFWCHRLVWAHAEHDGHLSVLYPPPRKEDLSATDGKILSLTAEHVTTAEVTTAADKTFKRRGQPQGPQVREAILDLQVRNALRLATVPTLVEMEATGDHGELALDELVDGQPPSESEEEELAEEVTTVEPEILAEDASCEYGATPETEAWEVRSPSGEAVEEAAKWYVRTYLEYNPPGTLSRIAYDLDLDPDLVRGTLRDLEDGGEVAAGAFVGGETPQYMLWVDKNTFEGLAKGRRVVRENVARQFALDKFFRGFEKIEDFFDTFLAAGLPFDIFNRLEDFQLEDWWDLLDGGEVLHGRFVRGHVFFTTDKLAQLLASAYRIEELDKLDLEVFDTISSNAGISAAGTAKVLGLKREEVQPSIDKLDRNVYIVRKFIEKKAWSSRNLYLPFELTDPVKDAKKQIIERYIKGTGPLTFTAVRSFTDFPFNEALAIVNELQEEGVIERVLVVGDTSVDMYVHRDDAEKLARTEAKVRLRDPLRVLSLYDPYIQHMWAELTTRYGEGWIFPVIRDGKLCGMVEKWRMSGVVDIREVKLDDLNLLEELLDELDRQMTFYKQFGLEVIRIRGAFGRKVPDLPVKLRNRFIKKGYHLVQDFLAKGDMVPRSFPKENVYAYLFHKQHIAPSLKFTGVMEAAKSMGGLRSDFEASLRVRKMRKLKRHVKSGDLVAGLMIPAHLMFATRRDMLIYKVAKSRPITDDMAHIVKMMDQHEGVTRRELMESAEMGRDHFEPAFNALYEGLYIIRDPNNLYVLTPEPKLDQETARRVVLERMIANVGLVSAEGLAMMSKHEFKIDEIKATLGRLEQAGKLAKGFFVEGDESLYWIIKKDIQVLPKMSFKYSFVLSPFDQLAQLLSQEIRRKFRIGSCFVIFVGADMAGAFKGTKKGNTLTLTEFIGGDRERKVLRLFEREWGLSVRKPTKTQEIDDWELMRYWEEHAY
ncbi:MAG: winged helix DNA-binding domain-containing protein, partial [Thermoplasmata archaeon]|nr:winged helix DNA-binding domain-containing protein [Thermoplasmata archaeon]